MKIAIIDKKVQKITLRNKIIHIDEQKVPLRLLDAIIVAQNTALLSFDIVKITKEGVALLLLSSRGSEAAIVTSSLSKNAEIKLAQYRAYPKALGFAKYLIKEKIIRHANQLLLHKISLDTAKALEELENAKDLSTLLGIEGTFAKRYFKHYFALFPKALHSGKRTKNPPKDPVNAMMSFWYMLVYNLITIRLLSFGFEPSIGFLHQPFRMHNALSSDLMELFRADINEAVYQLFANKIVQKEDFTKKGGVYIRYEGRKKVWKEFKNFSLNLQTKIDAQIANIRAML